MPVNVSPDRSKSALQGRSHVFLWLLSRISTSQAIIRFVLLFILGFFSVQFNPWVSLAIFLGSLILGGALNYFLDGYDPAKVLDQIEARVNAANKLNQPKVFRLAELKQVISEQKNQHYLGEDLSFQDKFMICIVEPIMYAGIFLSLTYGFFDTIHLFNISTHLVVILLSTFLFLASCFALLRWRCQVEDNRSHRRLAVVWRKITELTTQKKSTNSFQSPIDFVSKKVAGLTLKEWLAGHTWVFVLGTVLLLGGCYCLFQMLLPFQSLVLPPHWITVSGVGLLAVVALVYYASGFDQRVLHSIKLMFMTVIMIYFFMNFFKMIVVLFAQMPLSQVMSTEPIMITIIALSIFLGLLYGWWLDDMANNSYEQLRRETTVFRSIQLPSAQLDNLNQTTKDNVSSNRADPEVAVRSARPNVT